MIKYFLENEEWELKRSTDGASGFEIRASIGTPREIHWMERWLVPTGLFLEMPKGVAAMICTRSGLAINHGIIVLNAPGVVDSDYRGEVKVSLINMNKIGSYLIHPGDSVAQIVFMPTLVDIPNSSDRFLGATIGPFEMVRVSSRDSLSETDRGAGGHGSTGR